MFETLSIAAFGAALALAGGLAQALVARMYSQADRRRELLIEAYSDYLVGLSQRVATSPKQADRLETAMALLIAGKQKITAFAPAGVVLALADFGRTSQILSNEDAQKAMISLVSAMRKSVGVGHVGLESAIQVILFSSITWIADSKSAAPQ